MDEALKLWTKLSFRAGTLAHSFGADIYHNWTGAPEFRLFHFPFRNWRPQLIPKPGLATDRSISIQLQVAVALASRAKNDRIH